MPSSKSCASAEDATEELMFLLNELRAFGTPMEIPGDVASIQRRLTALRDYILDVHSDPVDVFGACRETLANPVQE